jgi:predicted ATP-binding protein involved in virulence
MYINKIEIQNIRSISHLEMTFDNNHAGWHVLIGDNGTGKSTVIKSIAVGLSGVTEFPALRQSPENWIQQNSTDSGKIELSIFRDIKYDKIQNEEPTSKKKLLNILEFIRAEKYNKINKTTVPNGIILLLGQIEENDGSMYNPNDYNWNQSNEGWFSVAYGPMRRFSGGDDFTELQKSNPKLFAHLSALEESFVLSEPVKWLKNLQFQKLENDKEGKVIDDILKFVNEGDLLPNNTKIEPISSKGVFFKDGNGSIISINDLSDGYRSVLSMTFEIIRQMILQYGSDLVFESIRNGDMRIMLPGVVLIDEIDAHLHPTWQTKIGEWFLKYFPKIQFIVTTHSPLVCRAAEHGTIWKLSSSDDGNVINQIIGTDKDRLVFGNVLDAFETDAFGEDVSRSEVSQKKLEKLAQLNMLQTLGKLDKSKEQELQDLKKIFSTDDTFKI